MRLKKLFNFKDKRWQITNQVFSSLFLTGAIIEFSQVGAGLIDGLVISRFLGTEAMAAEGIVHPIYSIIGVISGLIAIGMQVRCTQALGRGNRRECSEFFSASVFFGLIVSLIVTIFMLIFAQPFAALLGARGNAAGLRELASKYLTGIGIGIPSMIMTAILAPALQLDVGRGIIKTGALIEAVSDIALDIVAVKLGFGIFGVGLATAVASYLNLLYICTFFLKKNRSLHFVKPHISVKEFVKMLAGGCEKAVRRIANTLRPIILNSVVIFYGGAVAMSVLSIRNNFSNFVEIPGAGIASAVALLTGVYYGEINEEGLGQVYRQKNKLISFILGALCFILLVFAPQIVSLYSKELEAEHYDLAVFTIRMLAIQIPLQALIESRIKYLQAICRKFNMILLTIVTRFVFVIISAIALGALFGVYGILASFTCSDILTLITIYLFYAIKCHRIRLRKRDLMNLPEYFHLNPGDVISLDIHTLAEASLASEQIMYFCKGHGIHRRITYFASLVFEELASDIIINAFPKKKKAKPMIDMRVVIKDDTLVMCLRDNCLQYDITKKIAKINESESNSIDGIGIRIVSKTASDIVYLNTFETNNLIIKFKLDDQNTCQKTQKNI